MKILPFLFIFLILSSIGFALDITDTEYNLTDSGDILNITNTITVDQIDLETNWLYITNLTYTNDKISFNLTSPNFDGVMYDTDLPVLVNSGTYVNITSNITGLIANINVDVNCAGVNNLTYNNTDQSVVCDDNNKLTLTDLAIVKGNSILNFSDINPAAVVDNSVDSCSNTNLMVISALVLLLIGFLVTVAMTFVGSNADPATLILILVMGIGLAIVSIVGIYIVGTLKGVICLI